MAEFYAGDVFNRDGLMCYVSADGATSAKSYNSLDDITTYATAGVSSKCGSVGTITANTCTASSYEPIALKADVSEIEDALKTISARITALEESMPHRDNLRRELKTLNYKREL